MSRIALVRISVGTRADQGQSREWDEGKVKLALASSGSTPSRQMLLAFSNATLLRVIACCIVVLASGAISAKRLAPEPVKPVTVAGVTYLAPGWPIGFIIAKDASSNRELWRKRIYTLPYDRQLERDVQDVFITSLTVRDGNALIITNELGERYILDLSTRKIIRDIDRNP